MKSKWISHKGKRLIYVDVTNFGANSAALKEESKAIIDLLTKEPPNSVKTISNGDGTMGTPANIATLKEILSRTNPFVFKRAVVGVPGIRRVFIDTLNRVAGGKPFTYFEDIEAAKDWLVID